MYGIFFYYFTMRNNRIHTTRSLDYIKIVRRGLDPEIDYARRHETNILGLANVNIKRKNNNY